MSYGEELKSRAEATIDPDLIKQANKVYKLENKQKKLTKKIASYSESLEKIESKSNTGVERVKKNKKMLQGTLFIIWLVLMISLLSMGMIGLAIFSIMGLIILTIGVDVGADYFTDAYEKIYYDTKFGLIEAKVSNKKINAKFTYLSGTLENDLKIKEEETKLEELEQAKIREEKAAKDFSNKVKNDNYSF